MTFLAPLPAIIAACICVPALLALYLLKLRRRPVRVGSVLFWPKASEDTQANVPLRMIRPSWLLLLHLLALAALLIAFG
ncbi:MAG: BatA domain-containing protein, partial [Phycisphaerales bacterium]